jgi:hypothetical protein
LKPRPFHQAGASFLRTETGFYAGAGGAGRLGSKSRLRMANTKARRSNRGLGAGTRRPPDTD